MEKFERSQPWQKQLYPTDAPPTKDLKRATLRQFGSRGILSQGRLEVIRAAGKPAAGEVYCMSSHSTRACAGQSDTRV